MRKSAARRQTGLFDVNAKPRGARVAFRSVFDVAGSRLAIGHFNRPLAAEECSSLRRAWEKAVLPEVEDFEVSARQVSFLTRPPRVDATWSSIESLLDATYSCAKAS